MKNYSAKFILLKQLFLPLSGLIVIVVLYFVGDYDTDQKIKFYNLKNIAAINGGSEFSIIERDQSDSACRWGFG